MNYDNTGYLEINTSSAERALPIPKVNIRVLGASETNGRINYSLITDRNGKTKVISLPAPSKEYSLSPSSPEVGFSVYNIEAFGEGFYPKVLYDVAVFPGIKSVINLEMIPNGGLSKNAKDPLSDNISIIEENEDLN